MKYRKTTNKMWLICRLLIFPTENSRLMEYYLFLRLLNTILLLYNGVALISWNCFRANVITFYMPEDGLLLHSFVYPIMTCSETWPSLAWPCQVQRLFTFGLARPDYIRTFIACFTQKRKDTESFIAPFF